ncbi:uncharacterized protein LOC134712358 isoform X1 [Mytilus trossulus]|uniref:uncharacterized protein LOC134712358 isoform X1 n=2 Tax=Mytilus trossulus TaxID=6551 RepID=UPI003005324A
MLLDTLLKYHTLGTESVIYLHQKWRPERKSSLWFSVSWAKTSTIKMRKRSISDEKENISVSEQKSDHSQKQKRPKETFYTVEEFVKEDVYLINRKTKVDKNLLANSLTAKLRQGIPGEVAVNGGLMNKIRRESLKDLVQLNHLNKQLSNEMQMEANRIDSQSQQLVRRQEQMKRQSEYLRKNQDKIRSQIRGRSGNTSSKVSSLPTLKMSSSAYTSTALDDEHRRENLSRTSSRDSAKQRKDLKSNFNMFPVEYENEDPTYVKHFKHMGLFQPHNKYHHLNEKQFPEKSILRKSYFMPEYEILTLSMKDSDLNSEDGSSVSSKQDQKSQKKKGLRVTWTGLDRETDDRSATTYYTSQSPTDSVSVKSFKSDSNAQPVSFTKPGKSKLDCVGIRWKLPPQGMRSSLSAGNRPKRVSHNLHPCASAMNKFGTSITKQKWAVPTMTSNTSTYELYKNWLAKLELLKNPNEDNIYPAQRNQTTNESISYTVPVTERPPVSMYTV